MPRHDKFLFKREIMSTFMGLMLLLLAATTSPALENNFFDCTDVLHVPGTPNYITWAKYRIGIARNQVSRLHEEVSVSVVLIIVVSYRHRIACAGVRLRMPTAFRPGMHSWNNSLVWPQILLSPCGSGIRCLCSSLVWPQILLSSYSYLGTASFIQMPSVNRWLAYTRIWFVIVRSTAYSFWLPPSYV